MCVYVILFILMRNHNEYKKKHFRYFKFLFLYENNFALGFIIRHFKRPLLGLSWLPRVIWTFLELVRDPYFVDIPLKESNFPLFIFVLVTQMRFFYFSLNKFFLLLLGDNGLFFFYFFFLRSVVMPPLLKFKYPSKRVHSQFEV